MAVAGKPAKDTPNNSLKTSRKEKLFAKEEIIAITEVSTKERLMVDLRPQEPEKSETISILKASTIVVKEIVKLAVDGEI
jgi:hypothetical protein